MNNQEINIGTIGHRANDKVTLSKMIAKILEFNNYDNYSHDIDSNINNITISKNDIKCIEQSQTTINYNNTRLSLIIASGDDLSRLCYDIILTRQEDISHVLVLVKNMPDDDIEKDIIQRTIYTTLDAYGYNKDNSSIIYDKITENTISNKEYVSLMVSAISNMLKDNSLGCKTEQIDKPILNNNIHIKNMVKNSKNTNARIKTKYSDNKYLFRNHTKR